MKCVRWKACWEEQLGCWRWYLLKSSFLWASSYSRARESLATSLILSSSSYFWRSIDWNFIRLRNTPVQCWHESQICILSTIAGLVTIISSFTACTANTVKAYFKLFSATASWHWYRERGTIWPKPNINQYKHSIAGYLRTQSKCAESTLLHYLRLFFQSSYDCDYNWSKRACFQKTHSLPSTHKYCHRCYGGTNTYQHSRLLPISVGRPIINRLEQR